MRYHVFFNYNTSMSRNENTKEVIITADDVSVVCDTSCEVGGPQTHPRYEFYKESGNARPDVTVAVFPFDHIAYVTCEEAVQ